MGFRSGAYAKVWEVSSVSNACTKVRLSISKKGQDGKYEQEFGDFCLFCGTAVADKALKLKEGDRIKLGDVDVSNQYNKDRKVTYYNCKVYGFEMANGEKSAQSSEPEPSVDDGEVEAPDLPF